MENCIFCKIIQKKIPAKILHEDLEVIAFQDLNPQAPAHVLVVPKKHINRISDLQPSDESLMGRVLLRAKDISQKNNWKDYRLVFNNGEKAGQTVFHIHLHLLSGRRMKWPPG